VQAELIVSAARPEQFPKAGLPEVALLGRSNVGKSSLINRLVGKERLAFTSSTPGCTQVINFYRVDDLLILVDLPGYGYARVPREKTVEWKRLIEGYLMHRPSLELSVLLLDARRGWMEKDLELKRWLEFYKRKYIVVATKVDKLNQKEEYRGLAAIRSEIPDGALVPFSAVTGRGVRELWQAISKTRNR
jgi:ribosome biogenesis GTP-binding protein YsxC/EngB